MTAEVTRQSSRTVVRALALATAAACFVAYTVMRSPDGPSIVQGATEAPAGTARAAAAGSGVSSATEPARVTAVPVTAAPEQAGSGGAEVPVAIDQLPEDLRQATREAIRASRHACQTLGIPFSDVWPRLRPSDAREMIQREADLKKQHLDSALMEQKLLFARMSANPSIGIRVPSAERATLDDALKAKYPGWPDGYRFAEESDAGQVWIAAWKVEGDVELEQLTRDHDALTGEYSASVRAGYRVYFHY